VSTTLRLPRGFTLTLGPSGSYYTIATIDPPLPVAIARNLADARHPQLPRSMRDHSLADRVGEVVRAHGDGNGLTGAELETYQQGIGVADWSVDSPEGVGVLVAWLFNTLASGTLDAAAARELHLAKSTDSVLAELGRYTESNMIVRMVVDGNFDAKVNADDPRWVALKARFSVMLGSVA
jgi:hypothetical protein